MNPRFRRTLIILMLLITALLVSQCSPQTATPEPAAAEPTTAGPVVEEPTDAPATEPVSVSEPTGTPAGEAASEPKVGGTLRVGFFSDITGLDPTRDGGVAGNITPMLFERLVDLKPDGSVGPALATEWEWVTDTQMRFNLREGVTFHSGTPFNAEVVKWNIERLIDPDVGAIQFAYLSPLIEDAEVEDEYTVLVNLKQPFSPFAKAAANNLIMRDPVKAEELGDAFSANPSGTGPFMLKDWQPQQYVLLERNPDWWGEGNYVGELRFDIIPEAATRVQAMKLGEIDVLTDITPEQLIDFQDNPSFVIATSPSDRIIKFDFNYEKPVWQNANIRKAILLAVDTQRITEALIEPFGTPAKSMMTSVHESYWPQEGFLDYDPEQASSLLEGEGVTKDADGNLQINGEPFIIELGVPPARDLRNKEVTEAIGAQLTDLGFQVNIITRETADYFTELQGETNPYDIFFTGWGSLLEEVGMLTGHYYGPTAAPNGLNLSRRSGDPIDSWIDEAIATTDQEERIASLHQIQEYFYQESMVLPVYDKQLVWVLSDRVQGFQPYPGSAYPYLYIGVWLDPQ